MALLSLLLFAPHAQLCAPSSPFDTVDCSRPGPIEMRETAADYYRPQLSDLGRTRQPAAVRRQGMKALAAVAILAVACAAVAQEHKGHGGISKQDMDMRFLPETNWVYLRHSTIGWAPIGDYWPSCTPPDKGVLLAIKGGRIKLKCNGKRWVVIYREPK